MKEYAEAIEVFQCVLPRLDGGRVKSTVIFPDGTRADYSVRPETILRFLAGRHCVDFDKARNRAAASIGRKRGAPFVVSLSHVLVPFHVPEVVGEFAYLNISRHYPRVMPGREGLLPDGKGCSIVLGCGAEVDSSWSMDRMQGQLNAAAFLQTEHLRRIVAELPPMMLIRADDAQIQNPPGA